MIEVTVAYPAGQGRTFNMDYYLKTHIPLFQKRMGAAMKTIRVSRGIGGSTPRAPEAFVAMVHATFDSAEVFASAFAPHAAELQGDAPNYTNIQPVVQISEVLMG
ncbi:MAG TPA: EthD family reductase [Terriglobia bacterium]|nr:EthD family reductase [Terriglobia bacterium]